MLNYRIFPVSQHSESPRALFTTARSLPVPLSARSALCQIRSLPDPLFARTALCQNRSLPEPLSARTAVFHPCAPPGPLATLPREDAARSKALAVCPVPRDARSPMSLSRPACCSCQPPAATPSDHIPAWRHNPYLPTLQTYHPLLTLKGMPIGCGFVRPAWRINGGQSLPIRHPFRSLRVCSCISGSPR